jgi:hypothetical protein
MSQKRRVMGMTYDVNQLATGLLRLFASGCS